MDGPCASGAAVTIVQEGQTYRGIMGEDNLLQGRGNITYKDGTVITGWTD
jgi:hypothetical protein